ncbi:MAG: hypothetical protein JO327_04185 [Nitrososphaeraceae archaeon]|nr:hypothetical protein [Nitrososphaeraceae archaeon]
MSWKKHKTTSKRKLITLQEWADFLGVSHPAVSSYIAAYQKRRGEYNPKDIISVLKFHEYLFLTSRLLKGMYKGTANPWNSKE